MPHIGLFTKMKTHLSEKHRVRNTNWAPKKYKVCLKQEKTTRKAKQNKTLVLQFKVFSSKHKKKDESEKKSGVFLTYKIVEEEEQEMVMKDNCSSTEAMPEGFPINHKSNSLVNYRITLILHQINEKLALLKCFTCFQNWKFIKTESLS